MRDGTQRFIARKRPENSHGPAWFSGDLRVALTRHDRHDRQIGGHDNSNSYITGPRADSSVSGIDAMNNFKCL